MLLFCFHELTNLSTINDFFWYKFLILCYHWKQTYHRIWVQILKLILKYIGELSDSHFNMLDFFLKILDHWFNML